MDEPCRVPFAELDRADDAPGTRAREVKVAGVRWAKYGESTGREERCEKGHRSFVLSGEIEYQFDDGREALRAAGSAALLLPPAALDAGAHRGRNLSPGPTRLFFIDDPGV